MKVGDNVEVVKCIECGLLIPKAGARYIPGETGGPPFHYCINCYKKVSKKSIHFLLTVLSIIAFFVVLFIFILSSIRN